ncbi:hypothetical protein CB1_000627010 [Camelus ferus]|nr:hypothetical protein CB1_000627010 [Camelus ferus]
MPEMVVKIIGSKHFRYLAEKPKIKENKNLKAETQTMLQKSVTGNARQMSQEPPAPTNSTNHQINPDAHDVEESKHSEHNQKLLTGVLGHRFLDGKVNYEKLLQFLTVTALGDPQQSKTVEDSSMKGSQGGSHRSLSPASPSSPAPQDSSCHSGVNKSLLEILKMALKTTNDKLNTENLNLSFRKGDRSFSGCLPPPKKTPEEDLQPENPPAKTSAPTYPLSPLKMRPVSQPSVSPVMKNGPEERETWIDRFRKLENALYLCDLSNTGVLEKERARRLIHNYNLIYNLSLSPQKIDQALRRFRAGGNTLLEPALRHVFLPSSRAVVEALSERGRCSYRRHFEFGLGSWL